MQAPVNNKKRVINEIKPTRNNIQSSAYEQKNDLNLILMGVYELSAHAINSIDAKLIFSGLLAAY